MLGRSRAAPGGALRPRVWPRQLRRWSTVPSSEGQSSGQEVHQLADPGPRPGCQAQAGQLRAARCAPVCGPGSSGADLLPPAPRGRAAARRSTSGPIQGHGPDVRQRPGDSRRRAAPPCVALVAGCWSAPPQLRGARAAARRPTSGPVRATARMSGRDRAAPGGALRPVCGPGGSGAGLLSPSFEGAGRRPGGPPAGRSGPWSGCQAQAGQLQAARCAPVCGPGRLRCWSAPPAPRGQGDGQKARQRADLSHWPDVGQRPDSSRRCAVPPCVAPAAPVLIYCPAPREQGSGQEARQRAGPGHGPGCQA